MAGRRVALAIVLGLALAAAGVAAVGWPLAVRYRAPFQGYDGPEQFVEITPGSSTRAIGLALVEAGVVRDQVSFRLALWRTGAARRLKAGEYRFDRPLTAEQVVARLARGEVFVRQITFPEGLAIRDMARIYEAQGFGPAEAFVEAASEATLVADLDPAARDLEGYLFPETYAVTRQASAATLVEAMVHRFRVVFTDDLRREAIADGFSVREAVTLASIVEKETARGDERAIVAGVYRRRLAIGMALQSDPTVIYGLARIGRYAGNLTRDNMAIDTPYNTYRRPGLPPGPIAAPGRAALEAAVRPATTDYLYFVSRNDGSHAFARTLAEHSRNVRRFQVVPFRAGRSR